MFKFNGLGLMIVVMATLTGCQTVSERTHEALAKAIPLNETNAQALIDSHTLIDVGEDDLSGRIEYVDQVNISIARQVLELTTNPVPMRYTFKLSAGLYDADAGGFMIPLDTAWLLKQEAITKSQAERIAVVSSNNLFDSNISHDMELASFNQQIFKGIALSQFSGEQTELQRNFQVHALDYKLFINDYSDNAIKNLINFNRLVFGNRHVLFEPYERFRQGRSPKNTWRAAFYLPRTKEQAEAMLGSEYSIVFLPSAAFKIKETGQYIVMGTKDDAVLEDDKGNWLDGQFFPTYYSYNQGFTPKTLSNFTCERMVSVVKYDSEASPSRIRHCDD